MNATFQLVGSLLIRSGQDSTGRAPDVVHLKSCRLVSQEIKWLFDKSIHIIGSLPQQIDLWGSENLELFLLAYSLLKPKVLKSILSGTSLAGVLRHRAERIVHTLGSCSPIVDKLFGYVVGKQSQASRLVVHEKVIENATDLVQNRIAIDRFTGGAYHGALFDEQPIFGSDKTIVTIELELRNPKEYEIGLLLLLLKDLWTSDLPVGGESSIGRGRLQGKEATLTWEKQNKEWKISQSAPEQQIQVSGSNKQDLEDYVEAFVKHPQEEVKEDA
ncbi:MAG: hypothetical protein HC941_00780 [Microcoleus sp. SU_5_3]|nr:hypothetical protein [Microcoleus sp. SU_5_3]